ncbi:MAG: HAD hydrolase-like protein [Bacteroidales bacterium]|nr:HAD hydrolase-like protein [Bacteroidales bacterium]
MTPCTDYKAAIRAYTEATGKEWHPRAALIDMDGTLYDSMPNHARAWQRLMREQGIDLSYEEFFLHEGRTGAATIDCLFRRELGRPATEDEKRDLYHLKTIYFQEQPPVDPMPGAEQMLCELEAAGIRRILVTGSGQSSLISRLSTDYPGAFSDDDRITSRNVSHGKPHPEPYLKAMELARTEPWESIVIENAPLGVESGVKSGAFTIALTTGPIPQKTLADAGAHLVLPSMLALADILPELLSPNH